jgi:DNA-binding transcriptional regulator/RsmH inhibitor MraZ
LAVKEIAIAETENARFDGNSWRICISTTIKKGARINTTHMTIQTARYTGNIKRFRCWSTRHHAIFIQHKINAAAVIAAGKYSRFCS